jgi:hypothetical protein
LTKKLDAKEVKRLIEKAKKEKNESRMART